MTDTNKLFDEMLATYPDGHIHQGAWFYLTRGAHHFAVTHSDPMTVEGIDLWNVTWFPVRDGAPAETPRFRADVPTSAVLPTLDEIVPMLEPEVEVDIPGRVVAEFKNGVITSLTFTPHAGDAGYFGPSALVGENVHLDVENTEGPFWRAMQDYLADNGGIIWTE